MVRTVHDKIITQSGMATIPCVVVGQKSDLADSRYILHSSFFSLFFFFELIRLLKVWVIDRCQLRKAQRLPRNLNRHLWSQAPRETFKSVSFLHLALKSP